MLEPPTLSTEKISAALRGVYGLQVSQLVFLPLGADPNTAVYRVVTAQGTPYFLKLRQGAFEALAVTLPQWLSAQGLKQIIAPLTTTTGQLWANLEAYTVLLYPFVAGQNGYKVQLTAQQWAEFGAALKQLHTAQPPPALRERLPREAFSPQWRVSVKNFLQWRETECAGDAVAIELVSFLQANCAEILALVARTEQLAATLQTQALEFVVCHTDAHAGNVLVADTGAFYIVDWDNPILAPKERDLMFIGGGQGFVGYTAQEETARFYQGYGPAAINSVAVAYYRYERIIQDIAAFCEALLLTQAGGADRAQALHYLKSNFLPGGPLTFAYQADKTL